MKTENVKEFEVIETGFEIIDLDVCLDETYGGDNICNNPCQIVIVKR